MVPVIVLVDGDGPEMLYVMRSMPEVTSSAAKLTVRVLNQPLAIALESVGRVLSIFSVCDFQSVWLPRLSQTRVSTAWMPSAVTVNVSPGLPFWISSSSTRHST